MQMETFIDDKKDKREEKEGPQSGNQKNIFRWNITSMTNKTF